MGPRMMRRWIWAGLIAGLGAGCNGAGKKVSVLDPLPGPVHVGHRGSPTPVVLPTAPPSAPKVLSAESWLPPNGLSTRWRYIIIHHTASSVGSLDDIDQWHRDRGWENGCGYDFVVGNGSHSADGQVEVGPRWHKQQVGAHVRLSSSYARKRGVSPDHYNEHGIGIVLVGDLSKRPPTEKQMASLARLVKFLMETCGIREDRIVGHRDVDQTRCPGRYFSMWRLKRRLRALR